jgi:hypothetical protein
MHAGFLQKLYWIPDAAGGMRGGFGRKGDPPPSESAHDFVFDMDRPGSHWDQEDHSGNA